MKKESEKNRLVQNVVILTKIYFLGIIQMFNVTKYPKFPEKQGVEFLIQLLSKQHLAL